MTRIMVVEDDDNIRAAVTGRLRAEGLQVDAVDDISSADQALRHHHYDCVVFDRMLPSGDAVDYVRTQRQRGWNVAVLFLTARDALADRIAGFEHGGDDYLVKPFGMAELTARVANLCRRSGTGRPPLLSCADLQMDTARREVRRNGTLLTLSGKEFSVLEQLLSQAPQVVGRAELIEHCWDSESDPMSNVVDVVVRRLRRKLGEPELLHTARGRGYRLGIW